jgi:hypothetical protein
MADVDAVIAALRIVLHEVERQTWAETFQTHIVNKWIGQLPGAWTGRWNRLLLEPRWTASPVAYREPVITHLRSTPAYLEANRDAIAARRSWWRFGRVAQHVPAKASEVAVNEVVAPTVQPQDVEEDDVVTPKGKLLHSEACLRMVSLGFPAQARRA